MYATGVGIGYHLVCFTNVEDYVHALLSGCNITKGKTYGVIETRKCDMETFGHSSAVSAGSRSKEAIPSGSRFVVLEEDLGDLRDLGTSGSLGAISSSFANPSSKDTNLRS
ncbi:hypothetical protein Ancab_030563 [Ancistrocladus abbreviatus]